MPLGFQQHPPLEETTIGKDQLRDSTDLQTFWEVIGPIMEDRHRLGRPGKGHRR